MTATALMILLTYGFLLFVATATGYSLLDRAFAWTDGDSAPLRLGASYFVGISFFIVVVRTLTSILNSAQASTWIALVIALGLCVWSWRSVTGLGKSVISSKWLVWATPAMLVFSIADLFYWLQATPFNVAESHVGTLHSVRYAMVANFINANNVIPSMSQNSGQIILTAMGGAISGTAPFAYLYLWLMSSVFFLAAFAFGFIRRFEPDARRALLATAVFMFGSTALSLAHVLIIDSGSPFGMCGYTDTLLGVFSVLMLLLINQRLKSGEQHPVKFFAVTVVICAANFFAAPQNMVFFAPLIPVLAFTEARRGQTRFYRTAFWTAVLLVAAIIGVPQGGMLTPKALQSKYSYPGALMVAGVGNGVTTSNPGVPFFYGEKMNWYWGPTHLLGEGELPDVADKTSSKVIWAWESYLATSLRVLFFPIVGLVALFCWPATQEAATKVVPKAAKGAKGVAASTQARKFGLPAPSLREVAVIGTIVFVVGFGGSFFFSLNSYKWELIRFMIPGMAVGLFGVSLLGTKLIADARVSRAVLGWGMSFVMLEGPVLNFLRSATFIYSGIQQAQFMPTVIATILGRGPGIQ